jgi:hypothetical protein
MSERLIPSQFLGEIARFVAKSALGKTQELMTGRIGLACPGDARHYA